MEKIIEIVKPTAKDIEFVKPRPSVEVNLPDGRVLSGPRNTPVGNFMAALAGESAAPIVGAVVNGELRELTFPIEMDARVRPVSMADSDGARIYRRSLTFLLEVAFEDLFPEASVTIDHSVSFGGYYCHVNGRPPLTRNELEQVKTRMEELVEGNQPFLRKTVPLADAIEYFQSKGMLDKVRLLSYRQKDFLILYELEDHRDYQYGYMVPSTGFLKWFGILPMGEGFILQYPRRHSPTRLLPMPEYPKLLVAFRQYGAWLQRLGIESVGALNDAIRGGRTREIILVAEALHEQQVAEAAEKITNQRGKVRLILISGPSSSGKTTFSKRLAVQLLAQGLSPFALELDNYFVDREQTPRDEAGDYDFESIHALNLALLDEHIHRLIAGEQVQLPRYNFKAGKSELGDIIQLNPDQILIMEGIHGLNPSLIPNVPAEQSFRIYVSCLTQLNLDRHNRISTTDTRLLRRIVRDMRERGYTAQQTIGRWESVRRGEKRNIFPFQENADLMFNSAEAYGISAMKPLIEPLLRQVPYGTPEHIEAKRLLSLLEWFLPIEALDLIPDNSILREFVGGSILQNFKLWQ